MHGYARVYDANATILLYPQFNDQRGELARWIFKKSTAQLQLATIDILNEIEMGKVLYDLVSEQSSTVGKKEYLYG